MSNSEAPTFQLPSPYPAAGEVIDGKYQVEKLLGEGGMGAVAKATHLLRRAPVALKFMSPAVMSMHGAVERFINEGVAASQIDSDHVVKIFDVGQMKTGAPYLVMEYLEGCDLSELLLREGQPGLEVARAVHFTLQALRGLQVAHAAGIVHRDMKPSNCFVLTKDGEPDFVKLVDFGISKVQQAGGEGAGNLTKTNSALGTPLYMSPEQARSPRDVDLRSDLYSTAVILYELLTGRTPFNSESGEFTEILFKIFTMDAPPVQSLRPGVPDGLAAAIHRALNREPASRYASAGEMGDALSPWADDRSYVAIQRLRNAGRPASMAPPAAPGTVRPLSVIPQSLEARASPESAMAKTQGAAGFLSAAGFVAEGAAGAARVPSVSVTKASGARTDMGAARDTRFDPENGLGGKRTFLLVAMVGLFVAALFVIGAFAMKKRATEGAAGSSSAPTDTTSATETARGLPPAALTPSVASTPHSSSLPSSAPATPTAPTGKAIATGAATTATTTPTVTPTTPPTPTATGPHKLNNIVPQQ